MHSPQASDGGRRRPTTHETSSNDGLGLGLAATPGRPRTPLMEEEQEERRFSSCRLQLAPSRGGLGIDR